MCHVLLLSLTVGFYVLLQLGGELIVVAVYLFCLFVRALYVKLL